MTPRRPPTRIQSVDRAVRVLEYVARSNGGVRASELAEQLDVPLPTVFHLLSTLTETQMLEKLADRRYQLGARIGLLTEAFVAQISAPEFLTTRLRELADVTGETAYLSAWRRGDAVLLSIVEGHQAVRVTGLHMGYSGFTHARASGKVLLAFSGGTALDDYLETHSMANGDKAVNETTLRRSVSDVLAAGFAIDEEEFAEGVSCIAAPVADGTMAMGISAPSQRFRDNRDDLIRTVVEITSRTIVPP